MLDLRFGFGGHQHRAVRVDHIAVALVVVGSAADHLFQHIAVVADRKPRVGHAVQHDRLGRHRKHHFLHAAGRRIARNHRCILLIQPLKRLPDMVTLSLTAIHSPIFARFIEHIEIAVIPRFFLCVKIPPRHRLRIRIRHLPEVAAPVRQNVPVPLGKHHNGLIHLFVGFQQVFGALIVDLPLDVIAVSHQTADDQRGQNAHRRPEFPFFLHAVPPFPAKKSALSLFGRFALTLSLPRNFHVVKHFLISFAF